ncbi:MAG: hypothetical protein AAGM38_10350 [Pseudomonadota bacterium]
MNRFGSADTTQEIGMAHDLLTKVTIFYVGAIAVFIILSIVAPIAIILSIFSVIGRRTAERHEGEDCRIVVLFFLCAVCMVILSARATIGNR